MTTALKRNIGKVSQATIGTVCLFVTSGIVQALQSR